MIRTINNLVCTLLFQAHLPPHFWVEAFHMATYLLNILPSTSINNQTPHFRLYNIKPTYTFLRVFGCLCYAYLDTNHKLGPRSTSCIFLGYPSNHPGYRCLNLSTNKIIISCNVTFDESIFPYRSVAPNDAPSYTFLDTMPNLIAHHIITSTISPPTAQPNTTQAPPVNSPTPPDTTPPAQPTPITSPTLATAQETQSSQPQVAKPNPHPNPTSMHPMVTRFHLGTNKKNSRYNCHVSIISPLPKTYTSAINDPNWQ